MSIKHYTGKVTISGYQCGSRKYFTHICEIINAPSIKSARQFAIIDAKRNGINIFFTCSGFFENNLKSYNINSIEKSLLIKKIILGKRN